MPGDVITVSPARAPNDISWHGGDPDCDHSTADQLSKHAVCRDCGASTLETVDMPDELLTEDYFLGTIERV